MILEIVTLIISYNCAGFNESNNVLLTVFYAIWGFGAIGGIGVACSGNFTPLAVFRVGFRFLHTLGFITIYIIFGECVIPVYAVVFCLFEQIYLNVGICTDNLSYPGVWITCCFKNCLVEDEADIEENIPMTPTSTSLRSVSTESLGSESSASIHTAKSSPTSRVSTLTYIGPESSSPDYSSSTQNSPALPGSASISPGANTTVAVDAEEV